MSTANAAVKWQELALQTVRVCTSITSTPRKQKHVTLQHPQAVSALWPHW